MSKTLFEKIENAIDEKAKNHGIMGTESVSIEMMLTESEKHEFLSFLSLELSEKYWWEFEGNTLYISYTEELGKTRIEVFEEMTLREIDNLPKICKIDLDDREVRYMDKADVFTDTKMRGIANVYNKEVVFLNEYELEKLMQYKDYKKGDGLQDRLYSDIAEVFKGIINKIEMLEG